MRDTCACEYDPCESSLLERPRYYPRQMVTAAEMTLEQQYFRDRLRRHNRLLHGWGVVCGALVCPRAKGNGDGTPEPWWVVVKPGYILGPYGDEIMIDCDRPFDLRTRGVTGITGDPCVAPVDPWCSEVYVPRDPSQPLYVAVKYTEFLTRPIRVQPLGCGCDETQCEYSRFRDGYEIGVITDCPESHTKKPQMFFGAPSPGVEVIGFPRIMTPERRLAQPMPACPECPSEPWVVLAEVALDANGVITKIDNCSCRRIVLSLAHIWSRCTSSQMSINVPQTMPIKTLKPGDLHAQLTFTGSDFPKQPEVHLGDGVEAEGVTVTDGGTKLEFTATVRADAAPGDRTLTVINPEDCSVARLEKAITITAAETAPAPQAVAERLPAAPRRGRKRKTE